MSSASELSDEQSKDLYVITTFCCPRRIRLILLFRELIFPCEESVEGETVRYFCWCESVVYPESITLTRQKRSLVLLDNIHSEFISN